MSKVMIKKQAGGPINWRSGIKALPTRSAEAKMGAGRWADARSEN